MDSGLVFAQLPLEWRRWLFDAVTKLASSNVPRRMTDGIAAEILVISDREIGRPVCRTTAPPTDWARASEAMSARRSFILSGPVMANHSLFACHLLSEHEGFYCRAADVADLGGPFWRAAEAPLLVLDCLGEEHVGDNQYSVSQINRLLELRISECRPFVAVTGLNEREVAKRYGSRLAQKLDAINAWTWGASPEPIAPFAEGDDG